MKTLELVEEEVSDPRPVSDEVLQQARDLIKKHHAKCFWFRHPEASINKWEDVYLVVQHLREYGGRRQWAEAQELWKLLSSCR